MPLGCEFLERNSCLLRFSNRLVIDIRDVAHMARLGPEEFNQSAKDILDDKGPEIPNMSGPIDCGAAAIEAERGIVAWTNDFELARECVT